MSGTTIGPEAGLAWRRSVVLILLASALCVAVLVSVGVGAVSISPGEVFNTLIGGPGPQVGTTSSVILWQVRVPRVLAAVLVGAALAIAGCAFQGLLRNPLADPYLLGVSGGASLGAVLALAAGAAYANGGSAPEAAIRWLAGFPGSVPLLAFVGALVATGGVYALAQTSGQVSTMGLVLAGIAMSAFTGAFISYLLITGPEWLQKAILSWLSGGLSGVTWERLRLMAPYVLVGGTGLAVFARDLDVMRLGDEAAAQTGVPVGASRAWVLGLASLVTAAAVSITGLIGFVGLIVPHMVRLLVGGGHRTLLPASALTGGLLLVVMDTVGRTAWAPAEVRVSIICGLAGAPYFLFLLRRHLTRQWQQLRHE